MRTLLTLFFTLIILPFYGQIRNSSSVIYGNYINQDSVEINLLHNWLCSSDTIPLSQKVTITSGCGDTTDVHLPFHSVSHNHIWNPDYTCKTTCEGGVDLPGRLHYWYTDSLKIDTNCYPYTLTYIGSRDSLINTYSNSKQIKTTFFKPYSFGINAHLLPDLGIRDDSTNYTLDITSIEDSMVISMYHVTDSTGSLVSYTPGYNYEIPIESFGLDSFDMRRFYFNAKNVGNYVIGFKIDQYNTFSKKLTSTYQLDHTISIIDSINRMPIVSDIQNLQFPAQIIGQDTIQIPINEDLEFKLTAIDPDSTDTLIFIPNIPLQLPGIQISQAPGNPVTASIQGLPPSKDEIYQLNFAVRDDHCSSMGYGWRRITLIVGNPTSTSEFSDSDLDLIFFPNPVKETIKVYTPEHGRIQIIRMDGRVILSTDCKLGLNEISMREMNTGAFILQFTSSDQLINKLIIKE